MGSWSTSQVWVGGRSPKGRLELWSQQAACSRTTRQARKDSTKGAAAATIPCPHCLRLFCARIGLTSHLRTHHSGQPSPPRRWDSGYCRHRQTTNICYNSSKFLKWCNNYELKIHFIFFSENKAARCIYFDCLSCSKNESNAMEWKKMQLRIDIYLINKF